MPCFTIESAVAVLPWNSNRLDRMMDEALTEARDRELLERWRGLRRYEAAPGARGQ